KLPMVPAVLGHTYNATSTLAQVQKIIQTNYGTYASGPQPDFYLLPRGQFQKEYIRAQTIRMQTDIVTLQKAIDEDNKIIADNESKIDIAQSQVGALDPR